jgi:carboxymethylenebutenolidase
VVLGDGWPLRRPWIRALCPDLYRRVAHGDPDDVAARAKAEEGVPNEQVFVDAKGCIEMLMAHPTSNERLGSLGLVQVVVTPI